MKRKDYKFSVSCDNCWFVFDCTSKDVRPSPWLRWLLRPYVRCPTCGKKEPVSLPC